MTPQNQADLERIKLECTSLVNKRALLAGAGAAVPLPAVDIILNVGILSDLIPEISRKFGLTQEQVDEYDETTKLFVFEVIRQTGAKLVAQKVTRDRILLLLRKMGVKEATKRFGKFVPIVGSIISAGVGYAAMKYLGNTHVDECYSVAQKIAERRQKAIDEEKRAAEKRALGAAAKVKKTALPAKVSVKPRAKPKAKPLAKPKAKPVAKAARKPNSAASTAKRLPKKR